MHDAPTRSTRRLDLFLPAATAAAWLLVATVHLLGIRMSQLWLLGLATFALTWLLALALTAATATVLGLRHRWRPAVATLAVATLAATTILVVDWTSLYVRGFHRLHQADFATARSLPEDGPTTNPAVPDGSPTTSPALPDDGLTTASSEDYYGQPLPDHLRHLSVTGRAARLPAPDGGTVLSLPQWTGIPDGAAGYLHSPHPLPPESRFDCFADPCQVRWTLGDGWHWVS
ncbi:hypothetical protein ABT336_25965 [Micromonospora sp. NPDC000207]|uniref:hypothetical protein n=1 Tax=Micromonospora sp. NPDC000207 TaxID=3154246 RepID=UPI00331A6B5C